MELVRGNFVRITERLYRKHNELYFMSDRMSCGLAAVNTQNPCMYNYNYIIIILYYIMLYLYAQNYTILCVYTELHWDILCIPQA